MKLYNTKTRQIEEFRPYHKEYVTMYTCGPTVYHFAHIGNLRNFIMEDILEKTLQYVGYTVKRCMNITDVGHLSSDADTGEDKMVKGAKREHVSVLEIAKRYTEAFFEDFSKLNIKKPEIVEPATHNIENYIHIIQTLMDKGYAYFSKGNVYFDVSKLENYYSLTSHKKEELVVGAREDVSLDEGKKNQADFVLWFTKSKFDDQELKWDSPWGSGYPGWHIECSCISLKYLGEYLDIHCGGVDNIFPHHTNEIAQSESFLGHPWCSFWVHGEHLNDETGKMSKSKGEFLTVSLLEEKGYDPLVYRLYCLQSHYRNQLVFSYEGMDNTKAIYKRLLNRVRFLQKEGEIEKEKAEVYKKSFSSALEDDLNTSFALTVLYDVLKSDLNDATKRYLVKDFDQVLSLDLLKEKKLEEEMEEYILKEIEKRDQAKKERNFELADSIREALKQKGILLKDTSNGTIYEKL